MIMWHHFISKLIDTESKIIRDMFQIPLPSSQEQSTWHSSHFDIKENQSIGPNNEFIITEAIRMYKPTDRQAQIKGVYFGIHNKDDSEVFIKIGYKRAQSHIIKEAKYLSMLQSCPEFGIPELIWCGNHGLYNIIITEKLGPSLSSLLREYYPLSHQSVLVIAKQLVQSIAFLHQQKLMHRDIKPANICMGSNTNPNRIYLVDFETCLSHESVEEYRVGTYDYMSINVHSNLDYTWYDDLESAGYTIINLMKGTLPWKSISRTKIERKYSKFDNKRYEHEILLMKCKTPLKDLCKDLPIEIELMMEYVIGETKAIADIEFERLERLDKPDYIYIQQLFSKAGCNLCDHKFEWSQSMY